MRRIIIYLLITCSISLAKDREFLSEMEYAKMLYENPRGIGCDKCHGTKGEGIKIVSYKHNGVKKDLISPAINNIGYDMFVAVFDKRSKIMPRYFLTDEEKKMLYKYISIDARLGHLVDKKRQERQSTTQTQGSEKILQIKLDNNNSKEKK